MFTGIISVGKELDRETQSAYHFVAIAHDGGERSCTTEVQVYLTDVNDNAPKFLKQTYTASIKENNEVNTLIIRMSAHDPDLGMRS